nr:hypothetical protein [Tanacetum cinerariifolium]
MSSHNAQSAVTYTSISSNSDRPSWGIPLMNAGELPEIDPYEEVAQQGQAHPLSPAYVPDPMELDEHVPVYVSEPEHPEYHAPSDDDIQVEDDDEDPEEDPNEEHEPEDEDTKEPSKGSDETEPFEEDEIVVTPPPPKHRGARIFVRPQTPMAASTQALIDAFAFGSSLFPLPPTNPAYDQAQLGRRAAIIQSYAVAARAPRSQYNFVDTIEAGQGLIRSPGHDTRTIARAADRAEDVGYVRALQASECRMMTSIEEVNLRVSYQAQVRRQESVNFYKQLLDAQTDRIDIRLEIDVVRSQRTAYETELQAVHQAYLSSEARNRELLARLETLETHMSHMEWQRQSADDLVVTQMMRIHTLEARAHADTVEDADSSWTLKKKLMDKYYPKGKMKKLEIELWNLKVRGNDVAAYTQRFQELASMCTKFLVGETEKVDKYISGLPDNIHGNVMSVRPNTLDETIELANDLMDQKLLTYAERQNESKRKANDSPRNNKQQPYKKQNVARAYIAGPDVEKNCPKLKNHGNGSGNDVAQGRVYAWEGETLARTLTLAMSSDNAQSTVTYTSISSNSDGPSWGFPFMNAGLMELDEHAPVYAPVPQHPEYHAPSDDDIQVEDDDDDPAEDPIKEHEPEDDDEDPEEDPNEEHESKGSDESEPFKEDKIAVTPPPPRHRHRAAMIHRKDDILVEDMPPRRIFIRTGPPPGCDVAESLAAAAARAPRSHYDFVDTVSEHRMMNSIEEVNLRISYQAQVRRQESENFYTRLLDAQTDRRDIRLEIVVVRGQRTAYETELQERQSAEDLAVTQMMRIYTLEARARVDTVKDANSGFTQMMRIYTLEARARVDMVKDANSGCQSSGGGLRRPVQSARVCSYIDFMKCQPLNFKGAEGVVGLSQWLEKMESVFYISGYAIDNQPILSDSKN